MSIGIIILAAGKGTRMQSKRQKILHEVGGKPMVLHLFEAAEMIADQRPVLVVSPDDEGIEALIGERGQYAVQEEPLGTGHATRTAEKLLRGRANYLLVCCGDMPLVRAETLQQLVNKQKETGAAVVMMSVLGDPTSSFGRVIRDESGAVREICEVAEAKQRPNTADILAIRELNASVYCFSASFLWANIGHLPIHQARSGQEYYLTDMIEIAVSQGLRVEAVIAADSDECLGAGTRAELVAVEKAFRQRAINRWLANGVTIVDPATTFIDQDVKIGPDTVLWPNSYLQGDSIIGNDCTIGPNSLIRSAMIGDRCHIEFCVVESVVVPDDTYFEPFSHVLAS